MRRLMILLEMIKIQHTVFALPFAFMGALLGARGLPSAWQAFFILLAMVGARSAAMAFNRLADQRFDAANPRTRDRALPAGLVSRRAAWLFTVYRRFRLTSSWPFSAQQVTQCFNQWCAWASHVSAANQCFAQHCYTTSQAAAEFCRQLSTSWVFTASYYKCQAAGQWCQGCQGTVFVGQIGQAFSHFLQGAA